MSRAAAAALAALALASCASGGGGAEGGDLREVNAAISGDAFVFVAADLDRDAITTREEADAAIAAGFAAADADASGALEPLEWRAWSEAMFGAPLIGPFRLDVDRNVDNTITQEEFVAEFTARFDRYDADENGALTRAELVRSLEVRRERVRQRGATPPGRPDPRE